MKLIRIALVSDAVLPFNKGGKETRIYHLSKELLKQGYRVDIYTMCWWGKGRTYTYEGITFHALCRQYSLYSGNRRSITEAIMFGIATLKMLFYSFDILEVDHMPYFQLYTAKIVSLIKRKPLYATWHEVWGHSYWQLYLGRIKGTIAFIIERGSVKLPNHIVAVSNQTLLQLREVLHYHGSLSLVSNGIDYHHISTLAPSTLKSDVIYAGRLLPHKHVDLLIEAIAELRQARPNVRGLIVGDGPELVRLKTLVHKLKLEKNVTFTGFMETSDEVLSAMKASRVFVLPSSREGFGIAVLEAYGCGLQVVSVNCPDNAARHLVSPGAGIVCELTANSIAESINHLLTSKPKSAVTRRTATKYDWHETTQALGEVYAV